MTRPEKVTKVIVTHTDEDFTDLTVKSDAQPNAPPATLTYDLTVADLHSYYVLAGTTALLVHNCGEAAVDTNAVIAALQEGKGAEVDAALAGRAPVVSPQTLSEIHSIPHEAVHAWLNARGGRVGAAGTTEGAKALQAQIKGMWSGKSFRPVLHDADALVLHSAILEGLPMVIGDNRFRKNAIRLGVEAVGF